MEIVMKRIETLIHPPLWDDARAVLETLGARVTLREVRTFGRTPPKREVYRGTAYFLDVAPELELTIMVEDALVENTIAALETIGSEGEILVSSVDAIVRFGQPRVPAAAAMPIAASAKRPISLRTAAIRA
jgi:nitrogen regulatory protein P-II 1